MSITWGLTKVQGRLSEHLILIEHLNITRPDITQLHFHLYAPWSIKEGPTCWCLPAMCNNRSEWMDYSPPRHARVVVWRCLPDRRREGGEMSAGGEEGSWGYASVRFHSISHVNVGFVSYIEKKVNSNQWLHEEVEKSLTLVDRIEVYTCPVKNMPVS